MIFVSKENIYPDLADWCAGQAGYNAMEHSPNRHELLRLDIQLLHGVMAQDVDAAPAVYQHAGELGISLVFREGGIQNRA